MNNSLINTNTSIIILVIAILIFVYMNINDKPLSTTQEGGVDCNPYLEQVNKMIKGDIIYSILLGGPQLYAFIVIILILVVFALKYGVLSTKHDGLLFLGYQVSPVYTINDYSLTFFKMFDDVRYNAIWIIW